MSTGNTLPIVQECRLDRARRCQTGGVPDSPTVPADVHAAAPAAPAARRGRPGYDQRQILEVAVAVFNEQGYDATSVAALADRLGLSKSAMYHHFDSKEQLLSLALDEALGSLEGVLQQPGARTGDAGERLGFVLRSAVHRSGRQAALRDAPAPRARQQ